MDRSIDDIRKSIRNGDTALGIELGSTRIKAVLIDETNLPVASGSSDWENRFENGIWTYSMEDVETGLRECCARLVKDVEDTYGISLTTVGSIGISAMMHGYLAFDKSGELLVPFRTWRNTITHDAASELTKLFNCNIPERWSIAHLYQAILNEEPHVSEIASLTTLAGYVHRRLTGVNAVGLGEASGMFPIDPEALDYDEKRVALFDALVADKGFPWKLRDILPKALNAGEYAGVLTEEGAAFLDPSGKLKAGIPVCPPEGDAGTGMTATNSVDARTGNISAGTSVFAMVVLEKELSKVYPEIDIVTTPTGKPVAMVHVNNCTSDINAWVNLFKEFYELMGHAPDMNEIFVRLFNKALEGERDCGGLISYCYLSGETITGLEEGRPLFVRRPDSKMSLANFMRTHICGAIATLKIGLDILFREEGVKADVLTGHGGFFKTKGVGQKFMAAACGAPVSVMETAGEGGAWGMALLAAYLKNKSDGETLEEYLKNKVFASEEALTIEPDAEDAEGFDKFMENYKKGLAAERAAVKDLPL